MVSSSNKGFTLVELSIVLVIISLIVSGVLVGRDLIEGARLRATVQQIGDFNTAVNTFELRYNALPGDANGARFGLTGTGNGDGTIVDDTTNNASGEPTIFWQHLSEEGLISGNFTEAATSVAIDDNFPATELNVNGFAVYGLNGVNFYHIGQTNNTTGVGANFDDATLTPIQAYNIDEKLDNEQPHTGTIRSAGGDGAADTARITAWTALGSSILGATQATNATNGCVNAAGDDWDFPAQDQRMCQLRIQMR